MNLNINTRILLKELRFLSKTTSRKVPAPVLSCIHIKADKNKVYLTTSNLEITTKAIIEPNSIKEEGAVVINCQKLVGLVDSIETEDISLTSKDTTLSIKAGKSNYKIQGEPVANFPDINAGSISPVMHIVGSNLYAMINKCMISLNANDERFNLNGVLFKGKDNVLTLTSTDGMRLSNVRCVSPRVGDFEILVPKSSLDDIKNILLTNEEETSFGFDNNYLWFGGESRILISRLSSGKFPQTETLFFDPKTVKTNIALDRKELFGCLQRLAVTGDSITPLVDFSFRNDTLTLSSHDDTSEGSEFMSTNSVQNMDVTFNLKQIAEFLAVSTAPKINIQTDESANRFQWYSADLEHKYIVNRVVASS